MRTQLADDTEAAQAEHWNVASWIESIGLADVFSSILSNSLLSSQGQLVEAQFHFIQVRARSPDCFTCAHPFPAFCNLPGHRFWRLQGTMLNRWIP